jgi:hypothetical protein
MAGRALVTGGFLLCGWFLTGGGHAYASTITAAPAPHQLLAGAQASGSGATLTRLARPVTAALSDAVGRLSGQGSTAHGLLSDAVHGLGGSAGSTGSSPAGSLLTGLGNPGGGLVSTGSGQSGLPVSPPAITTSVTGVAPAQLAATRPMRVARVQWRLLPHAVHAVRRVAPLRQPEGYLAAAVPASHAAPSHVRPVRHPGAGASQTRLPHRAPPGTRLGTGATTQPDPTSAGGGTGTAQTAVQSPPGSQEWNPAGRLIRVRMSRCPVVRQAVDDPAVSPD